MKKKKAKSKTAANKAANKKTVVKKSTKATETKELNPAQVLKDISALVEAEAEELAEAVIGEGKKGQVSPVKFLFEMAHIFPATTDESSADKDEDSLAETLLHRLNIPTRPLVHDLLQKEEGEDVVVIQPKKEAVTDSESSGDEKTEAVGVK